MVDIFMAISRFSKKEGFTRKQRSILSSAIRSCETFGSAASLSGMVTRWSFSIGPRWTKGH